MDTIDLNNSILDTEELKLISAKHTETNQLAFAVMLKVFQIQGYYPTNKDVVSPMLITVLAHQLDSDISYVENFNWESRSAKRFRKDIRDITGYRQSSEQDGKRLIAWLIENVSPESPTHPKYREKAYQFFREQKLEPFKPQQLDRYILSANYRFEKQFFLNIYANLSAETIRSINSLLPENEENDHLSQEVMINPNNIKLRDLKKVIYPRSNGDFLMSI